MSDDKRIILTARTIKALAPRTGGAYYISDAGDRAIKGLQLRIAEDGSRSWSVRYRVGKRQRRLTLGDAQVIPLNDDSATHQKGARTLAREALHQVANGSDPADAKAKRRTAQTIGDLATLYIEQWAKPRKKSWTHDQRRLNKHVLPNWKHTAVADLTRSDVKAVIATIAKKAPVEANRTQALVSKLLNFAVDEGVIPANPILRMKKTRESARDRVLSADEIRSFWKTTDSFDPAMRAFYRLRLITAQRGGEVADATWSEFDLDGGWWTIPKERSKNKLAHRVPLSSAAVTILTALHTADSTPAAYVLLGARSKRLQAEASANFTIKNFRGHDLRRTAATLMSSSGTPRLVVSKILNHAEKGITAVYDRSSYDNEKRIALDAWARTLTAILDKKDGANVVAFARP